MSANDNFDIRPFPREREIVVDSGYLGTGRHLIYGLVEVDVTAPRERLRALSEERESRLSFTAYLAATLGQAIAARPIVQAYRDWRGRLVIFHDADIVVLIEPEAGRVAIPHIIRAANHKSVFEISDEIRAVQARPARSEQRSGRLPSLAQRVPRFVRMFFYWFLRQSPQRLKQTSGTAVITSVGMFGRGSGWGMTFLPLHTLGLTVGGIARKPVVVDDQIAVRDILHLTLAFDHDVVDGAPAARFAQELVDRLERGAALEDLAATGEED